MTPTRRHAVPAHRWNRVRDHLPPAMVAAGDAAAPPATVEGYRHQRHENAAAMEAALGALAVALVDDLGAPAETTALGALLASLADLGGADVEAGADSEGAGDMSAGDRAAARRLAATAAGELSALLRRAAVRAETVEAGLLLRAEDLESDQRIADHRARAEGAGSAVP